MSMEGGQFIAAEWQEGLPALDLYEAYKNETITIGRYQGTLHDLGQPGKTPCPVEWWNMPLEARNRFTANALNENKIHIRPEDETQFRDILEPQGREVKVQVAADEQADRVRQSVAKSLAEPALKPRTEALLMVPKTEIRRSVMETPVSVVVAPTVEVEPVKLPEQQLPPEVVEATLPVRPITETVLTELVVERPVERQIKVVESLQRTVEPAAEPSAPLSVSNERINKDKVLESLYITQHNVDDRPVTFESNTDAELEEQIVWTRQLLELPEVVEEAIAVVEMADMPIMLSDLRADELIMMEPTIELEQVLESDEPAVSTPVVIAVELETHEAELPLTELPPIVAAVYQAVQVATADVFEVPVEQPEQAETAETIATLYAEVIAITQYLQQIPERVDGDMVPETTSVETATLFVEHAILQNFDPEQVMQRLELVAWQLAVTLELPEAPIVAGELVAALLQLSTEDLTRLGMRNYKLTPLAVQGLSAGTDGPHGLFRIRAWLGALAFRTPPAAAIALM